VPLNRQPGLESFKIMMTQPPEGGGPLYSTLKLRGDEGGLRGGNLQKSGIEGGLDNGRRIQRQGSPGDGCEHGNW
jgi:hypothetical protein